MNTIFRIALALAVMVGAATLCPQADAKYYGGVNERQRNQQNRIYKGMGNGSLNGREAARLERQQFALNQQEQRFRASGNGLSMSERARLARQQNALSHNIYQQRHDGQSFHNGQNRNSMFDINKTQQSQANRITDGVRKGELTQTEAMRLQGQQAALANREAQMRASGGGLSLSERARLDAQQDRLSRNIYEQKHDSQVR